MNPDATTPSPRRDTALTAFYSAASMAVTALTADLAVVVALSAYVTVVLVPADRSWGSWVGAACALAGIVATGYAAVNHARSRRNFLAAAAHRERELAARGTP